MVALGKTLHVFVLLAGINTFAATLSKKLNPKPKQKNVPTQQQTEQNADDSQALSPDIDTEINEFRAKPAKNYQHWGLHSLLLGAHAGYYQYAKASEVSPLGFGFELGLVLHENWSAVFFVESFPEVVNRLGTPVRGLSLGLEFDYRFSESSGLIRGLEIGAALGNMTWYNSSGLVVGPVLNYFYKLEPVGFGPVAVVKYFFSGQETGGNLFHASLGFRFEKDF
jgi:hypothetical protein